MKVEQVPLDRLRVDRVFAAALPPPDNLDGIREDLRARGVLVPLVATEDGLLLDGHTRLELARALGLATVPVVRLPMRAGRDWGRTVSLALNLHRRHMPAALRAQLGTSLLKLERRKAAERQAEGGRKNGGDRRSVNAPKSASAHGEPKPIDDDGKATAVVAKQLGLSRGTLERSLAVLDRGDEATRTRLLAGGISVSTAYGRLRRAEVGARGAAEAAQAPAGLFRGPLEGLAAGRYRCLYADPPWAYRDATVQGAAAGHYGTLDEAALAALPVARLAHPEGCHLWLWATWPLLRDSVPHRLLAAWGFAWRGEVVWRKPRLGLGRWLRVTTEVLILATRGPAPVLVADQRGDLDAPQGSHSAKPTEARAVVERCSPAPRLEMFARQVPAGWDAWGDECQRTGT